MSSISRGGKPEPGESRRQILIRELDEELGVLPAEVMLLGDVDELSALERVPMRMTVFTARLVQVPAPPPSWPPWPGPPAPTLTSPSSLPP